MARIEPTASSVGASRAAILASEMIGHVQRRSAGEQRAVAGIRTNTEASVVELAGEGFVLHLWPAVGLRSVRWDEVSSVHLHGQQALGELAMCFGICDGSEILLSELDSGWDELMLRLPRHLHGFPDWTAMWTGPVCGPVSCLLWQRAGN